MKVILIVLTIIAGMAAVGVVIGMAFIPRSVLISGVVSLGLGIIAAAAGFIACTFKRMEELAAAAGSAAEARSCFLTGVIRGMRGALNAIVGSAKWELGKRDNVVKPETRANLENIYCSGLGLLDLINVVLDIAMIESGKFELVPVNYDMTGLLNDTAALNIVRAGGAPVAFKLDIDENMPARLYGDEARVKQILNSLLSCAFKYTREGEVKLQIRCERDAEGVWMTCTISDTGNGIQDEDIEVLFGDYNPADAWDGRPVEGTRLGLAITRRLVEMMRGVIYVKSEYDKGTTFVVRLFQGFVSDTVIGNAKKSFDGGLRDFPALPAQGTALGGERASIRIVEDEGGIAELTLSDDEWDALREVEASLMIADMVRAAELEDLDWEKGLDRFGGDGKSYVEFLRSYVVHTRSLLDSARTPAPLEQYAVVIHGIKDSSLGISADSIGLKAERLEYAARNGNLAFVEAENDRFIGAVEKFIVRLTDLLDTADLMLRTPRRDAPDSVRFGHWGVDTIGALTGADSMLYHFSDNSGLRDAASCGGCLSGLRVRKKGARASLSQQSTCRVGKPGLPGPSPC
jgi:signal transduction histidine kinase